MNEVIHIHVEWETDNAKGVPDNSNVIIDASEVDYDDGSGGEESITELLSQKYGWLVKDWNQIDPPEQSIFFDSNGKKDLTVLTNYMREQLDAREGKEPENKEWTPGRWSGYTSCYSNLPHTFTMENENDGGSVKIEVQDDHWEDNVCVLVTKKYIIRTNETESNWNGHLKCYTPTARDEVAALIGHVTDLHGEGTFSLYLAQQKNEVESLKAEVKRLKDKVERMQKNVIESTSWGSY